MEIVKLEASPRPESGKGPAKRLRREGKIPAVAYGKQLAATPIAVSPKLLHKVLVSEHGQNSVLELAVDGGKKITAMLRDYSYHPVSRELLHADFIEIKLDQPVDVEVPFECTGKAVGIVQGGVLRQVYRKLPVRCLPEKIPTKIEHDVTPLNMGDHLKASELKLPEGVTVRLPTDQTIAGVVAPEKIEEVAAPGAPGAPAAAAAAGAAAPAAAGAAAPAAAAGKEAAKAPAAKEKKK
jgi:large subunit ribosomal protein L25